MVYTGKFLLTGFKLFFMVSVQHCINKNKILVFVNNDETTGYVIIDKVTPPKYYIGDIDLTEYDVRNIQLQVCKGDIDFETANSLEIKDEKGLIFNFREDGRLTNNPYGYDILARMTMDMLKEDRLKK
jgi:hypothetical protein